MLMRQPMRPARLLAEGVAILVCMIADKTEISDPLFDAVSVLAAA